MALKKNEKEYLLKLARESIDTYLRTGKRMELSPKSVPAKSMTENGACFVTLRIGPQLRGCIGTLEAHRPLVFDVIENALCSAFEDPRFHPLRPDELQKATISISVLSAPKPFPVKDAADLLKKLVPGKHGLIIQKGYSRATFLPAVWEELKGKEEFLSHLCMKAGLDADAWHDTKGIEFFAYEAEEFSE